jgi:hypothetical protein
MTKEKKFSIYATWTSTYGVEQGTIQRCCATYEKRIAGRLLGVKMKEVVELKEILLTEEQEKQVRKVSMSGIPFATFDRKDVVGIDNYLEAFIVKDERVKLNYLVLANSKDDFQVVDLTAKLI